MKMKKRLISLLLTLAMVLSMLVVVPAVTATAAANTFNASDAEPLITTRADFLAFESAVEGGNDFAGKTVKLGGDIYLGTGFDGVGTCTGKPFSGNFDGQGHTISYHGYLNSGADANVGLFNYIKIPGTDSNFSNNNIYFKNVHVTGNLVFGGSYVGGVICAVDAGTTGYGGTLTLENVWCSVNMYVRSSGAQMVGGIVGYLRQGSGLKPVGLTFESCVWDGCLQFDVKTTGGKGCGGFIGSTHTNNKTTYLTFKNSVAAGRIMINTSGSDDVGMFIGYAIGNQSSSTVTYTATNLLSIGEMVFDSGVGSNWFSVLGGYGSGTYTTLTANNVKYYQFTRPGRTLPLTEGAGTPGGSNNTGYGTKTDMLALTASSFTEPAKWNKTANYYPCPQGIIDTFGEIPATLYNLDITNITTAAGLQAVAQNVMNGVTYSGQTITLNADIDLSGLYWRSIGSRNDNDVRRPFQGTIEGNGHTVKLASAAGLQSEGGLVGYTEGATIQNLRLTGTMDIRGKDVTVGYYGTVIGCVGSGTTTVTNVLSDVTIYLNAIWFQYSGGFIGGINNNFTATLNCTDCVYAGTIWANASVQESGGFFGYSGQVNSTSYTKTLNFTRCMFAGNFYIDTTTGYISDTGLLAGYIQHNSSNTGYLNVTLTDCLVTGKMTFGTNASALTASANKTSAVVGWAGKYNSNAVWSATNIYYIPYNCPDGVADGAKAGDGEVTATAKTATELGALTSSNFSSGSDWSFESGYMPCPKAIVTSFGWLSAFGLPAITIGSKDAFLAFRDAVNSGTSYAGQILRLTADIDLDGEAWREIGRASGTSSAGSNVFRGVFDGAGHTIKNMTTLLEPVSGWVDMQGGLFGNLGDGAVVKNFTLTGTMTLNNYYDNSGTSAWFGSVANAVSGTVLIQNVTSYVNISTTNNANPTSGKWGGGFSFVGGLVGFALHNSTTNLTIDNCEYAGSINCRNYANGTAGILAGSGNGGTKVFNITNTTFSGNIYLNDSSGSYAYSYCSGIVGYFNSGTLNISNSHAGNSHFYFNRTKAWTATEISAGQIVGQASSGTTVNIASSVSYSPAVLYTSVSGGVPVESSKFVLGEIGKQGDTYTVDTAAHMDGFDAGAERCTITVSSTSYNSIRFTGSIYNTASCTGGGTKSANFGVFIMSRDIYDLFNGAATYAKLDAAATALSNVVKVMAVKYEDTSDSYTVKAVVFNINPTTELVAVPYVGTRLGDAVIATYNGLA